MKLGLRQRLPADRQCDFRDINARRRSAKLCRRPQPHARATGNVENPRSLPRLEAEGKPAQMAGYFPCHCVILVVYAIVKVSNPMVIKPIHLLICVRLGSHNNEVEIKRQGVTFKRSGLLFPTLHPRLWRGVLSLHSQGRDLLGYQP